MGNILKAVIGFILALGLSLAARAAEERFLSAMPTSGKTTAREVSKSKKPGYLCAFVKQGEKGNPNIVKGSKSFWFSSVPESQDVADDMLSDGKKVVRCTLKLYDKTKRRMINANIGDEE